jgi:hypothetical protein
VLFFPIVLRAFSWTGKPPHFQNTSRNFNSSVGHHVKIMGVILIVVCHWAGFKEHCTSMRDAVLRICFILNGTYSGIVQICGI